MHGLRRSERDPSATGHILLIAASNQRRTSSGVSAFSISYVRIIAHIQQKGNKIVLELFWNEEPPPTRTARRSPLNRWPRSDSTPYFRPLYSSIGAWCGPDGSQTNRLGVPLYASRAGHFMVQFLRFRPVWIERMSRCAIPRATQRSLAVMPDESLSLPTAARVQ